MRAVSVQRKTLLTLLLALSLACGTPASMSMEWCDGDRSGETSQTDDSKHKCCHDQDRHSDECQADDCQCHSVAGGALPAISIIADDYLVAVTLTLASSEFISTIHDLPKRPPRHV